MGNSMARIGKDYKQLRRSIKNTQQFYTVQHRKGDRLINIFSITFMISMGITVLAQWQQSQLQKSYSSYRQNVFQSITSQNS